MPRMYLTPVELNETPLALGLAASISQLGSAGAVDKLLARASLRCDAFVQKRLGAPIATKTIGGSANAGDTQIQVASSLNLDDLAENAVIVDAGGVQETVPIKSGGVEVISWTSPYPAKITLDAPLQFSHANGTPVQFVYREVTEAGSSSSSDPYTESLQTQAMQLALAHLPPARQALTRVLFVKNYPIIKMHSVDHAFSFTNEFNAVDLTIESIVPNEGWLRFNVGTVLLREGLMRTTYTGGYQEIPDDVKTACSYYFAEEMRRIINPYGLRQSTMGKRTLIWDTSRKSTLVMEAEDILKRYRRLV